MSKWRIPFASPARSWLATRSAARPYPPSFRQTLRRSPCSTAPTTTSCRSSRAGRSPRHCSAITGPSSWWNWPPITARSPAPCMTRRPTAIRPRTTLRRSPSQPRWPSGSPPSSSVRGQVLNPLARRPLIVRVVRIRLTEPPRRRLRAVLVMPVPPLIGRGLRIPLRRVFPFLLAPKGGHVEEAPGIHEHFVAAVVDEVGAVDMTVVVADERVGAMPFVDAEVFVKVVGDREPRYLPTHPRLHPLDVGLLSTRGVHERGVTGVQMSKVADVVGHQGAAHAAMLGPPVHTRIDE